MNDINIKSKVFQITLILAMGMSWVACDADMEDAVAPKTLEAYKAEFTELVSSEKTKVENTIVGYNKGDFKGSEFFNEYSYDYMVELIAGENVLANPELTIADIWDANYKLSAPGKLFNDNIFISDRRELNDLIGVCDTLYVHTPAGTEPGMAPDEDRVAFKTDINEAKSVRDRMTSIDRQITEEVDSLTISLAIFEEAIIK